MRYPNVTSLYFATVLAFSDFDRGVTQIQCSFTFAHKCTRLWLSIGKSETEQTMSVKSFPTQIVVQIQITLKNVIEIQNTKHVLKVSKIQITD